MSDAPTTNAITVNQWEREIVQNSTLMRTELLKRWFDPRIDLDKECGYPITISLREYKRMYEREGIGSRVVGLFPRECWADDPEIYESEDPELTPWEERVQELLDDEELNVLGALELADELSGIGTCGLLLMGFSDTDDLTKCIPGIDEQGQYANLTTNLGFGSVQLPSVSAPPPPPSADPNATAMPVKLLYLTAYDEDLFQISNIDLRKNSPRFGQPTLYKIKAIDPSQSGLSTSTTIQTITIDVHWSRVLHLADGAQTSRVFGAPRMRPVWNYLLNLRKLLGGSAEMFWKGAFPGISFELNPELALGDVDFNKEEAKEQMAAYQSGLQRYFAIMGVSAKSLAPQVSSPADHIIEQLKALAITLDVPLRVLVGSEMAQLASEQDTKRWNGRLKRRCTKYITPRIIRPFFKRLMAAGVLPFIPKFFVEWNDLNSPTDLDKAEIAYKKSMALAQYVLGQCNAVAGFKEFCMLILGMNNEEADSLGSGAIADEQMMKDMLLPPPPPMPPGAPGAKPKAGSKAPSVKK